MDKAKTLFQTKRDELKAAANGLMQAVIVYQAEQNLCCESDKCCFELNAVVSGIGEGEKVDAAAAKMKEFVAEVGDLFPVKEQDRKSVV